MHRTTFCDPGQALALLLGEIALEGDLLFDNVNLSIVLALAVFAVLCVNFWMLRFTLTASSGMSLRSAYSRTVIALQAANEARSNA